ncbi:MAG: DNA polymerase I [Sphaerochaetaceae bacterium]|nr:DNA polymerase I [Sphaerochaetaceae bacterium]
MSEHEKRPKLFIIDGYSIVYRSYFAFINRPLRDKEGNNVSAFYGFFNTLLMLVRQHDPDYLVVAMDTAEPTFRHIRYPQYKANRESAPEDLHAQVPLIIDALNAANIPQIGRNGWEADDVIASLIHLAKSRNIDSVMVTGDKDLLQLVDESTMALRPPRKGEKEYRFFGEKEVIEEFGVAPNQIVDYLALIGDSSDNVPGVAGIGPKGALKLIQDFGNLETIYEHLADCSASVAKKLEDARDMAFLSQELIELKFDALSESEFDPDAFSSKTIDWNSVIPMFEKAQARTLINTVQQMQQIEIDVSSPVEETVQTKWNKPGVYHAVTNLAELEALLKEKTEKGVLSFDLETTGIDDMTSEPVGFSFTDRPFEAWYVPIKAGGKAIVSLEDALKLLKTYIVEKKVKIIGQNLKYDYKILVRWGVGTIIGYFDTMVAAWLLDAAAGMYNMDHLANRYLDGYRTLEFKEVVVQKDGVFSDVPLETAVRYAAEDADITWRLYEVFSKELISRGMDNLFFNIEMPLVKILADMELNGVSLDVNKLYEFDKEVTSRISAIEQEIYALCGKTFNINSTKQLQEVLFVERKLPTGKKNKTGFSTATETLEQLAQLDEVPRLILQNRALVKLKNTYIDSLPQMVLSDTGRIHTSFVQTGTATGRLSSRNPNLQNIPVRSDDGKRIREAFIAPKGYSFLSADYSQIELVVLAHMADDKALKEAFIKGEDIHRHTAAVIFDIHPELVTSDQRRMAKTINFGVMYGMSAFRLANELQIPQKAAKVFIEEYFTRFNGVQAFVMRVQKQAEQTGKVATIMGRERQVPEIRSSNKMEKAGAERIVVNTVIQGTAADIIKLAMIKIAKRMADDQLHSKLLLQVHDELIFEVPETEITKMQLLVKDEMEHAIKLSVPIRVGMAIGKSWGELG